MNTIRAAITMSRIFI